MELTGYKPKDQQTADTLQSIIRQTVIHINNMRRQEGEKEVTQFKLDADKILEDERTKLIAEQAGNAELQATTEGSVIGAEQANIISEYFDNVENLTTDAKRDLLEEHMKLESSQIDTHHLAEGN